MNRCNNRPAFNNFYICAVLHFMIKFSAVEVHVCFPIKQKSVTISKYIDRFRELFVELPGIRIIRW